MSVKIEKINSDITIRQHGRSLAFGTDAYLLSSFVRRGAGHVCELGAGSGVITLLMAARGKIKDAVCVEVQESIADLCRENIVENGFSDKITVVASDMRNLPREYDGTFDTVVTNPPYMRLTSGKLNADSADIACRHELFGDIGDFSATAARLLKFGGLFYAVYRPDRLSELCAACEAAGLSVKVMTLVYPTANHVPSAVLIRAKKGAAKGMKTTRPLIIYGAGEMTNENYTSDMKYIYENGDFNDGFR
ncbi:MAG: methyltransferase [Clostridia bacterium]|nr:methyltransferase [Clostridia bacterium]